MYGLNKMEMGYEVVCDCLKAGKHYRARLLNLSKMIPPTAEGTGRLPQLTESITQRAHLQLKSFLEVLCFIKSCKFCFLCHNLFMIVLTLK